VWLDLPGIVDGIKAPRADPPPATATARSRPFAIDLAATVPAGVRIGIAVSRAHGLGRDPRMGLPDRVMYRGRSEASTPGRSAESL
jgi:hypothetical protein